MHCDEQDTDDAVRAFELALDLAVDAARIGAGVIPLAPETFAPRVSYDQATRDVEAILGFMRDGGALAVVGGGRLLALDLEHPTKKGTDGRMSIAAVERALGALPRTRATRTRNGGEHLLFVIEGDHRIRPAQEVLRRFGIAIPGVDVVTGAIRLPPTRGYTVACDAPIAPLPTLWLRALSDPPSSEPARVVHDATDAAERLTQHASRIGDLGTGRSAALNAAAFTFAGSVDGTTIRRTLLAAAERNGSIRKRGVRACERIILGGMRARLGRAAP